MGIHHLELDGRWELLDFAKLVRPYAQVYSFSYALNSGPDQNNPSPRVIQVIQDYSKMGGWSSADFYDLLYRNTPERYRPVPKSMHYSSPGHIDIGGLFVALWALSKVVNMMCDTAKNLEGTYHHFHQHALEGKILRANVRQKEREVSIRDMEFADRSAEVLSKMFGIDQEGSWERTEDPISRMEITFSLYRKLTNLSRINQLRRLHVVFQSVNPDDNPKANSLRPRASRKQYDPA